MMDRVVPEGLNCIYPDEPKSEMSRRVSPPPLNRFFGYRCIDNLYARDLGRLLRVARTSTFWLLMCTSTSMTPSEMMTSYK